MRTLLIACFTLLLLPVAASAGGFATAGVLNPPQNIGPGDTWTAQIEILQHGRTPLEGVDPAVVVGDRTFPAKATGKPGIYTAEVVFPRAGRIEYAVLDGFTDVEPHTFVAEIGAAAGAPAAAAGGDFPWLPIAAAAFAAIGLAVLLNARRGAGAVPA